MNTESTPPSKGRRDDGEQRHRWRLRPAPQAGATPWTANQSRQRFQPSRAASSAVAGAIVGMKGMGRVGIDDELREPPGGGTCPTQRRLHLINRVDRDARVGTAVQAEHSGPQLRRDVHRAPGLQRAAAPTRRPYQATPAFTAGLCAS